MYFHNFDGNFEYIFSSLRSLIWPISKAQSISLTEKKSIMKLFLLKTLFTFIKNSLFCVKKMHFPPLWRGWIGISKYFCACFMWTLDLIQLDLKPLVNVVIYRYIYILQTYNLYALINSIFYLLFTNLVKSDPYTYLYSLLIFILRLCG